MKTFKLLFKLFLVCCSLFISCIKEPCCEEPADYILKFKDNKEYLAGHVYVLMNKDKSRMTGYPSKNDFIIANIDGSAYDSYKGYRLNQPNYGINTAYLNLTIEEFLEVGDTISSATMEKLIIDRDPYAEYYYDEDNYLANQCAECADKDTIIHAIDTVRFHRLVDNGELEKYLKRVK